MIGGAVGRSFAGASALCSRVPPLVDADDGTRIYGVVECCSRAPCEQIAPAGRVCLSNWGWRFDTVGAWIGVTSGEETGRQACRAQERGRPSWSIRVGGDR